MLQQESWALLMIAVFKPQIKAVYLIVFQTTNEYSLSYCAGLSRSVPGKPLKIILFSC